MFVTYRGSVFGIFQWQWRWVVVFLIAASCVAALDALRVIDWLRLTSTPVAVLGAALGIFVSFRTNAAYERWWEGRRLWGQCVNSSRMFATQVLAYVNPTDEVAAAARTRLLHRHAAWTHALRLRLRQEALEADPGLSRMLAASERARVLTAPSPTATLLQIQLAELTALREQGHLEELRLHSLDRTIATLLDVQGGCERIRNTPLPGGYGFISERLVGLFSILLPLATVAEIGWITIPLTVLVCLSLLLIGEVGRVLENPFSTFWPALPLSQLSTMIEIELRHRLGEADLPAPVAIEPPGILM